MITLNEAKKRFQSRKFGIFNHFLYGNPGSEMPTGADVTDWNARVALFDVERVARDLHEIGAGYYFITVMQGRKYMCAPNATFDAIAGTKPGEACAKRDLIGELAAALSKYDIDLYLYYTGDGPYKDEEIGGKFGFLNPRQNVGVTFVEKWASVLEEYAVRYGSKVKGWWIDGCYDYFGYNQEKLNLYYEAVRKGNPTALVTMNNGVKENLYRWFEKESFTSGEFNDFTYVPGDTGIGDSIPHILAPLGVSPDGSPYGGWCKPGCKCDGKYLKDYVHRVNEKGGVVSVDIHIRYDSTFDSDQLKTLAEIKLG